jgi:hypothetical protein
MSWSAVAYAYVIYPAKVACTRPTSNMMLTTSPARLELPGWARLGDIDARTLGKACVFLVKGVDFLIINVKYVKKTTLYSVDAFRAKQYQFRDDGDT